MARRIDIARKTPYAYSIMQNSIACFSLVSISAHRDAVSSSHHTKATDVCVEDYDCVSQGYGCVSQGYDYDFCDEENTTKFAQ